MQLAEFEAVHVPYPGLGPAATALLAGTVDVSLLTLTSALTHAQSGKLKILAVTGSKRSRMLPAVPTVAESGLAAFELTNWQGLLAPAGTPKEIIAMLSNETARALKLPDVAQKLAGFDLETVGSTPEQFAKVINAETAKWGPIIRKTGAKAD